MIFTVRGIEFNDNRLAKLSIEVLDELAVIGLYPSHLESIKLRVQNKKFGCCHTTWKTATGEVTHNNITINRKFIEQNATDKAIKEVLAHEICHAIEECAHCQHDGKWAEYADLINDCYNMDIKQYGSYEKYELTRTEKNEYRCKCTKCGKIMIRKGYRAPKWYKHPQGYTHTCVDGTKNPIVSEYYHFKPIKAGTLLYT